MLGRGCGRGRGRGCWDERYRPSFQDIDQNLFCIADIVIFVLLIFAILIYWKQSNKKYDKLVHSFD